MGTPEGEESLEQLKRRDDEDEASDDVSRFVTWGSSNGDDSSHTAILRTNFPLACETSKQYYKFIICGVINIPAGLSNEKHSHFSLP